MKFKVAIIGHSIVRDIASVGTLSGSISDLHTYEVQFFWISGSCFRSWLDWPQKLHDVIEWSPDIIFCILGSNSVLTDDSVKKLISDAYDFYKVLKNN